MKISLQEFGFKKVGEWILDKKNENEIDFKIFDKSIANERVIYAFTSKNGNPVKYIGICEKKKGYLTQRMRDYKNAGTSSKWKAERVREQLNLGNTVEIWALKPTSIPPQYFGLEIDLVRGLEYPLIRAFDPAWNTKNVPVGHAKYGYKVRKTQNGSTTEIKIRKDIDELTENKPNIVQLFEKKRRGDKSNPKSINLR